MAVNRLGDIIDDYCSRCRLLTNHSVVALVGEQVIKVQCRTCNHQHDYKHGKGGQKKKQKLSAYEEVLASVLAGKSLEPPKPVVPARPRRTPLAGPRSGRPRPTRSR